MEVTLTDGTRASTRSRWRTLIPLGARPFARDQYVAKFRTLAEGLIDPAVQHRFLDLASRLPELDAAELAGLALAGLAEAGQQPATRGIF